MATQMVGRRLAPVRHPAVVSETLPTSGAAPSDASDPVRFFFRVPMLLLLASVLGAALSLLLQRRHPKLCRTSERRAVTSSRWPFVNVNPHWAGSPTRQELRSGCATPSSANILPVPVSAPPHTPAKSLAASFAAALTADDAGAPPSIPSSEQHAPLGGSSHGGGKLSAADHASIHAKIDRARLHKRVHAERAGVRMPKKLDYAAAVDPVAAAEAALWAAASRLRHVTSPELAPPISPLARRLAAEAELRAAASRLRHVAPPELAPPVAPCTHYLSPQTIPRTRHQAEATDAEPRNDPPRAARTDSPLRADSGELDC